MTPLSSGPFLNLPSYKFVHNSRLHFKVVGVALYVKDTIRFHVLTELTIMHEKLLNLSLSNKHCKMKVSSVEQSIGLLLMTLDQIIFFVTT